MDKSDLQNTEKRLEETISKIGAKIAEANDIAEDIKELSALEIQQLKEAQGQLSDLYVSLDELEDAKEKLQEAVAKPAEKAEE